MPTEKPQFPDLPIEVIKRARKTVTSLDSGELSDYVFLRLTGEVDSNLGSQVFISYFLQEIFYNIDERFNDFQCGFDAVFVLGMEYFDEHPLNNKTELYYGQVKNIYQNHLTIPDETSFNSRYGQIREEVRYYLEAIGQEKNIKDWIVYRYGALFGMKLLEVIHLLGSQKTSSLDGPMRDFISGLDL